MSLSETVHSDHLGRLAVAYIRQSSPHQALAHQESLELQYDLQHRAHAAGWAPSHIRVIDSDLGRTGRTAAGRRGSQELVALVNQEQVGIIFADDATRLARNCTDWYQLLDLCGYRSCLVGDRDGIDDPATVNGRLILGLKGLISELELHTLRARLTAGLLNKARRGELALSLPIGLVRDALGRVLKHPDQEVQGRLELVFTSFLRLKAAGRVVQPFNDRELLLPRRDRFGDLVWRRPTIAAILAILKHPA
jgi:DNA invertase Pin-like site-specific DNA recombinase